MNRWVVLLVGLASVLNTSATITQHCERHGAHVMHRASEDGAPSRATWERSSHSDCPHCPPDECAQASPCASTTTLIVPASSLVTSSLLGHRASAGRPREPLRSTSHAPPTPPPQLIA